MPIGECILNISYYKFHIQNKKQKSRAEKRATDERRIPAFLRQNQFQNTWEPDAIYAPDLAKPPHNVFIQIQEPFLINHNQPKPASPVSDVDIPQPSTSILVQNPLRVIVGPQRKNHYNYYNTKVRAQPK